MMTRPASAVTPVIRLNMPHKMKTEHRYSRAAAMVPSASSRDERGARERTTTHQANEDRVARFARRRACVHSSSRRKCRFAHYPGQRDGGHGRRTQKKPTTVRARPGSVFDGGLESPRRETER
jgi:hypothetical protein